MSVRSKGAGPPGGASSRDSACKEQEITSKKKCGKQENGSFSGRKTSPFGLGVYVCSIHILHL
jgi:hypothetical protein